MRVEREPQALGPVIAGFTRGGYRVNESVYRALLITPDSVESWNPPPLEAIELSALTPILALERPPEFLLLGTGTKLVRPPTAFVAALEERAINVEIMDSRAAARSWGVLRGEGRWIIGALYPL